MTKPAATPPSSVDAPSRWRFLPLVLITVIALTAAVLLGDRINLDLLRDNQEALEQFRRDNALLLALGFVLAYALIVALSLPGATLATLTGGFLFGWLPGTVLNVTGASIGAMLIFQAARLGLGETLTRRLDTSTGSLRKLRNGLRDNELSVLFLMRLVPVVPFFVANVLPALVGVRFRNYALTTVLGIIPGALVYTSVGAGLGEVFARGDSVDLSLIWEPYIIGPVLGLCALAAAPLVLKPLFRKSEINQ